MNWNQLNEASQLEEMREVSKTRPILIFKHSSRCAISAMVLDRLERKMGENDMALYFLDLIRYREISDRIEREFNVLHQSPQAIILKDEKVIYSESHTSIDFEEMNSVIRELRPG